MIAEFDYIVMRSARLCSVALPLIRVCGVGGVGCSGDCLCWRARHADALRALARAFVLVIARILLLFGALRLRGAMFVVGDAAGVRAVLSCCALCW